MIKIAPSILAADFANLQADIVSVQAGGADYLHVDVMDGMFVPNISIGIPVVKAIRRVTDMVLDVHLMIDRPHRYVADFIAAGADIVVFHLEAAEPQDILKALGEIKAGGKRAGLSIKPGTPAQTLIPYLDRLDMVLIMTVEPGFGGQRFMADQLDKLGAVRAMIERVNPRCELEVDGGIGPETAKLCIEAGANVLVAGSTVFAAADRGRIIGQLRGS